MGKFKRIYMNTENGGYCTERIAKINADVYNFIETAFVYNEDTKEVFFMPAHVNSPIPHLNKNGKKCRFTDNQIVEID